MEQTESPAKVASTAVLGPLVEICERCKFWSPANVYYGTCKRYPPVADHVQISFVREMGYSDDCSAGDSVGWWAQPKTCADDWCGEYVLRA
jgi:hypothetical protein